MGRRGKNQKGFYFSVLQALNLHYQLEARRTGDNPVNWEPSPRNRPDQFLRWVVDSIDDGGASRAETFSEVLATLKDLGLLYIARALEHVVLRRTSKILAAVENDASRVGLINIQELVVLLETGASAAEAHPQARKFTKTLNQKLDVAWKEALVATHQRLSSQNLPLAAIILGGLPLGFSTVSDRIFSGLKDVGVFEDELDLSTLQFYALAVGSLPEAPSHLAAALLELRDLSEDQMLVIKNLSDAQVKLLRVQSPATADLLLSLPIVQKKVPEWRKVLAMLFTLSEADLAELTQESSRAKSRTDVYAQGARAGNTTLALQVSAMSPATDVQFLHRNWARCPIPIEDFKRLMHTGLWHQIKEVDDRLLRMIDKGELTLKLINRIRNCSSSSWQQIRTLLSNDWEWVTVYTEDRRLIEDLTKQRTSAQLNLRSIFPESIAWLDAQVNANFHEVIFCDTEDITTLAAAFSFAVKEQLFS